MEDLRNSILTAQNKNRNINGQCFVSDDDLLNVLTKDAVRKALCDREINKDCKLEPFHIDQAVNAVVHGAHRIFAILVYIRYTKSILQFIESDNYQGSGLDHRLPFEKGQLKAIFPASTTVDEFYERQWHFTAPIFCDSSIKRILPPEIILPIIEEESLGDGAFGNVYSIKIASSHQRFDGVSQSQRELVRKEFRPRDDHRSAYETELRNLSILKLLRHPNIIEVFSSYAYQKKLNLIFPRARGGTLKDLLSGPRPQSFISDASIIAALAGLCSAIYAVHQFASSSHTLELIGCHHDLKPANVLVEGSTFVLADFGLSRFKDASELSATPSRTVHRYYTPPECWRPDNRAEKPIIHRSSDIWSLGCIIAEVVTYMLGGVEGVEEFERQRAFEEGSIIQNRFHRGGAENPGVTAWIEKLRGSNSGTQKMLGEMVRQMLQLQHEDRPQAREVEAMMRFIATDAVCQPIQKVYQDICKEDNSIQPTLERTRFDSWRYACGILNANVNDLLGQMCESAKYPLVHKTLGQIYDELKAVLVDCKNPRSRIYEPLRQLNDLLLDCLSDEGQDRARMYLDTQMMLEPSDAMALAKIGEDDDDGLPQNRRLNVLATVVKCMTEVMEGRPANIGSIDSRRLERKAKVGDFKIQYLKSDGDESKVQVVVESKTYKEHYGDTRIATELQKRLEDVTELLRKASRAAEKDRFRVLRCAGFYQDPSAYSCGLIYEFPSPSSKSQKFLTLRSALEETQQRLEDRPSLEQRFQLAQALASSILKFHTVSWLQKRISSFNVAFFHSSNESWLNGITNPFFLGFLYSRSNDPNEFTEGPEEDDHHREYQHPSYSRKAMKNPRYCAEYDYYSLGLVLLEIGLWKPLGKILKSLKGTSPPDGPSVSRLDSLLQRCVPLLRHSMGTRYQNIVETCLCGSFEVSSSLDEKSRQLKLYRSFSSLVVEKLAECKV